MATCALLSADQFQCPICLEVFSDPVTTPCGHNFCQACIKACWAAPAHSRDPAPASSPPLWCPVCRETFRAGAGLQVNTGLRDLAEVFKRSSLEDAPAAAPGEVACDMCPPGPGRGRAVRSCLACLASYCGQHLKPHQQSPALQRHRLIGPAVRLEERMCPAHGRALELFCRREQSGLCPACLRDGCHDGHEVVAAEEEVEARRALLGELVSGEVERRRQAALQQAQEAELRLERGREKAAEVAAIFSSLAAFLEARRAELSGAVEAGLGRLEERGRALRTESAQLLCWSEELERLCADEDDLPLLLQKPFPPPPPPSATPSEAPCLAVDRALAALRGAVAQLEVSFSRDLEEVVRQLETPGAEAKKNKASVAEEVEVRKVQKVEKVEKVEVQKTLGDQLGEIQRAYAVDVMLDPDTANTWLSVSRSGKQVRFDEAWREFYSTWKTFMQFPYVVGTEGFSTSFYFEAQVRGIIQWEVGVFSECVIGHEHTLMVGEKRWTVHLDQGRYHAYSKYTADIHVSPPPEKVGVFVDFAHCQVLFYNVHTRSLMHCFSGSQIRRGSGRVFPAFSVGKAEDRMSSPPIVLTPICC